MTDITAQQVSTEVRGQTRALIAASCAAGGHNVKSAMHLLARALGLPVRRLAQFYYGEARRIDAHEALRVARLHARAESLRLAHVDMNRHLKAVLTGEVRHAGEDLGSPDLDRRAADGPGQCHDGGGPLDVLAARPAALPAGRTAG